MSNIERLEARISQVVTQMKSLTETSEALEKENTELKTTLADRDRIILDLEAKCEQFQAEATRSEPASAAYAEEIKKRISSVLKKMDQLEAMI